MRNFKPETIEAIERAVPVGDTASALEVWKVSGGVSHQTVKNALKELVERGRVLRLHEEYKLGNSTRHRACYRRVPA